MTHEELVAIVARNIADPKREWATDSIWADMVASYHDLSWRFPTSASSDGIVKDSFRAARAAISTIYEALQEPTPEMIDAWASDVVTAAPFTVETIAKAEWCTMLAASPLSPGEGK